MSTLETTTTLEVIECGVCHITFAMPKWMYRDRLSDKGWFWCPSGHQVRYMGERDSDKVQRLAGQLDQARTAANDLRARLDYQQRATKANATRLRKIKARVAHGVCPCCNRTFQNLQRHMETKHPAEVAHHDEA